MLSEASGQDVLLQNRSSFDSPLHRNTNGALHFRNLVCRPWPQAAEQGSQSDHELHSSEPVWTALTVPLRQMIYSFLCITNIKSSCSFESRLVALNDAPLLQRSRSWPKHDPRRIARLMTCWGLILSIADSENAVFEEIYKQLTRASRLTIFQSQLSVTLRKLIKIYQRCRTGFHYMSEYPQLVPALYSQLLDDKSVSWNITVYFSVKKKKRYNATKANIQQNKFQRKNLEWWNAANEVAPDPASFAAAPWTRLPLLPLVPYLCRQFSSSNGTFWWCFST